jgi:DsbC/DsbD-like thiol-disulfide interchange protein
LKTTVEINRVICSYSRIYDITFADSQLFIGYYEIMITQLTRRAASVFVLALAALHTGPAPAAQSQWSQGMGAKLRLIAPGGTAASAQMVSAGIEIRLGKGWKTYWRNPGESGIPPSFDFSKSTNISRVEVKYPVPVRDTIGSAVSLIYKNVVVFPLHIFPADPSLPMVVRLNALYGACEVVCVPERSQVTLLLSPSTPFDRAVAPILTIGARRVPSPLSADSPVGVAAVETVHADDRTRRALIIDIITDPEVTLKDLFLEGPPGWYLGVPSFVGMNGDIASYRLSLTTVPEDAVLTGTPIKLTIVSGNRAFETTKHLP